MRILAFSDLHRDLETAARLVTESESADVVIGAGDFASVHKGLDETIEALGAIECPAILVPGNNETHEALCACELSWPSATVLHGNGMEIEGVGFFGLGGGIPTTPWDWSFDLSDDEAREALGDCPQGAVLVVHSPPKGHCDAASDGTSFGSEAILEAIERCQPQIAVCGHIHESWGCESQIGETRVYNLGPAGTVIDI
jgi:Icc-related predicted phosphoesterase